VRAVPFQTGYDYSVYDHLKYMEVSNATFPVPQSGSFGVSADMSAQTPGTIAGLTQQGIYGPSGTWTDPANPPTTPNYSATVLEGQQAGVVINLVDFCTGQLFDWFLSAHYAFTLIERLPTNVTGNTTNASCPGAGYVGRDKMYTQIADEIPVTAARITSRSPTRPRRTRSSTADKQHVKYTGTYPSLGAGESLAGQIHSFSIAHGLFSLLDAFPFQHPTSPNSASRSPSEPATPPTPAKHACSAKAPTAPGTTSPSQPSTTNKGRHLSAAPALVERAKALSTPIPTPARAPFLRRTTS
jgi:hypothetical protein